MIKADSILHPVENVTEFLRSQFVTSNDYIILRSHFATLNLETLRFQNGTLVFFKLKYKLGND